MNWELWKPSLCSVLPQPRLPGPQASPDHSPPEAVSGTHCPPNPSSWTVSRGTQPQWKQPPRVRRRLSPGGCRSGAQAGLGAPVHGIVDGQTDGWRVMTVLSRQPWQVLRAQWEGHLPPWRRRCLVQNSAASRLPPAEGHRQGGWPGVEGLWTDVHGGLTRPQRQQRHWRRPPPLSCTFPKWLLNRQSPAHGEERTHPPGAADLEQVTSRSSWQQASLGKPSDRPARGLGTVCPTRLLPLCGAAAEFLTRDPGWTVTHCPHPGSSIGGLTTELDRRSLPVKGPHVGAPGLGFSLGPRQHRPGSCWGLAPLPGPYPPWLLQAADGPYPGTSPTARNDTDLSNPAGRVLPAPTCPSEGRRRSLPPPPSPSLLRRFQVRRSRH